LQYYPYTIDTWHWKCREPEVQNPACRNFQSDFEYLKSEIFEYLGNLGSENLIENSISPDVNNLYSLVISKNSVDGKIKTIELTSPLNLKNKENMGL